MTISSPFDILAATYDADFTTSAIGQLQRERVWHYLKPVLRSLGCQLNILEINCGTGEDACLLSAKGHSITATDASLAMIKKAKIKNGDIEFVQCAFDDLKKNFAGEKYDLIFSNFGGLNCIDEKEMLKLGIDLSSLLKDNGKLFFVVMGNACAWEWLHYSAMLKFKTAFRRKKKQTDFVIDQTTMPVYYYSPKKLKTIFSFGFILENKFPVGLFIPPSYLEVKFNEHPKRLKQLSRLENKFSYSFLSNFADHYCVIFSKSINA